MTHTETRTIGTRSSFLTTMLATAVFVIGGIDQPSLLPSQNYEIPNASVEFRHSWEEKELELPYSIEQDERSEILQRINLLHDVASQLMENSEELEPEIVKLVDEEFWNLI